MQPAYWPKNALGASGNRRKTRKCYGQTTAEFDSFSAMSALANLLMGGIAASSFVVELPEGRSLNVVDDMSHPFSVIHELQVNKFLAAPGQGFLSGQGKSAIKGRQVILP